MSKPEIQSRVQGFANGMTKQPTQPELKLKLALESLNIKFKFQKIVFCDDGGFIIDFYFKNAGNRRYAIEIDGEYHLTDKQKRYDEWRSKWLLERRKIKTIRFSNNDVMNNIDYVISEIKKLYPLFRDKPRKQAEGMFPKINPPIPPNKRRVIK